MNIEVLLRQKFGEVRKGRGKNGTEYKAKCPWCSGKWKLFSTTGELYNLEVARGTLSAEERYKINDHMVQTITMLEKLPYPKHLRDVPAIAGG